MRQRGVLTLLVTLGLGVGCSEPQAPTEVLRPVRVQTVESREGSRVRTFSGTARAGVETELSFRVSGTVERVSVKVGDSVRPGQEIARLEQEDYRIGVRQAEALLAQSEATLRNAESELERIRGLWENQNAAQGQLDSALAQAQSAQAQADGAQQALEAAKNQLAYTVLRSPVAGAIAAVDVETNENVRQGARVALLASGARPEVEIAIPEVLISQLTEGDQASASFGALPGKRFEAVVTEVGVASTGGATTFPVKVRLKEGNGEIRSGMAADVEIAFSAHGGQTGVFLPSHAVGEDAGGRFVYVVDPSDEPGVAVARRVAVEVGDLTNDGLEVLSGLDEGQIVVTAGVRRIKDGQRVIAPEQDR